MGVAWEAAVAIAALVLSLYNTLAQRRMRVPRLSVSLRYDKVWEYVSPNEEARTRIWRRGTDPLIRRVFSRKQVDGIKAVAANTGFRAVALSEWGGMSWRGEPLYSQAIGGALVLEPGRRVSKEISLYGIARKGVTSMPRLMQAYYRDETGRLYRSWPVRTPEEVRTPEQVGP